MLSIKSVSWGTVLGTQIAANGVFASESSATSTVVCCTLVDIYVITVKAGVFILKIVQQIRAISSSQW